MVLATYLLASQKRSLVERPIQQRERGERNQAGFYQFLPKVKVGFTTRLQIYFSYTLQNYLNWMQFKFKPTQTCIQAYCSNLNACLLLIWFTQTRCLDRFFSYELFRKADCGQNLTVGKSQLVRIWVFGNLASQYKFEQKPNFTTKYVQWYKSHQQEAPNERNKNPTRFSRLLCLARFSRCV